MYKKIDGIEYITIEEHERRIDDYGAEMAKDHKLRRQEYEKQIQSLKDLNNKIEAPDCLFYNGEKYIRQELHDFEIEQSEHEYMSLMRKQDEKINSLFEMLDHSDALFKENNALFKELQETYIEGLEKARAGYVSGSLWDLFRLIFRIPL